MKKIFSITATILVITTATILIYQFMFLQKPEKVLADISKHVETIRSAEASFKLTLDVDGKRLTEESGNARWTGNPTDLADYIDAKSGANLGPNDKAVCDVAVKTADRERKLQKIQIGDTVFLKSDVSGEKWVSYKQNEYVLIPEKSTGWQYINALLVATDHLQGYKNATGIEVVEEGGKKLRRLNLPVKRSDWLKALKASAYGIGDSSIERALVDVRLWVDYETYMPVKTEARLSMDKPQKVDCVFTITYSGFNKAYSINAPPAGEVITKEQLDKRNAFLADLSVASKYVEERKHEQALSVLKRLEREDPGNTRVVELIAASYIGLGKGNEAEVYVDKALKLNSSSAIAYRVKSEIAWRELKYRDVLRYAHKATQLNPQMAEAYYWLGNAYLELGNYVSAIEAYERAIVLKPGFLEPGYMLGLIYLTKSNRDKGARIVNSAVPVNVDYKYTAMAELSLKVNGLEKDLIPPTQEQILDDLASQSSIQTLERTKAEQKLPIFLFFYSKQCPVSLDLADSIKSLKAKYQGDIEFFTFDVEESAEALHLSERYKVSVTPSMLIIGKDDSILYKHNGYVDDKVLEQWLSNAIPKS